MPLPRWLARFNRYFTNPLARIVAGWAPGFAIIRHRGRRSGKVYSTPINIFKVSGGFVIALTYGSDVDWLKNVFAAGGCTVRYRRREIPLMEPEFLTTAEGMAMMPLIVRLILGSVSVSEFVMLREGKTEGNQGSRSG